MDTIENGVCKKISVKNLLGNQIIIMIDSDHIIWFKKGELYLILITNYIYLTSSLYLLNEKSMYMIVDVAGVAVRLGHPQHHEVDDGCCSSCCFSND